MLGKRKSRVVAWMRAKPAAWSFRRMNPGVKAISSGSSLAARRRAGKVKIRKTYGFHRLGSQKISRPAGLSQRASTGRKVPSW